MTWTTTTTQPDGANAVYSLFVYGNKLYAGTGSGNIEISSDNGVTWAPTTRPDGTNISLGLFVTSNTTIYATTQGGNVELSTNGGASWAPTIKPSNQTLVPIFISNFIF